MKSRDTRLSRKDSVPPSGSNLFKPRRSSQEIILESSQEQPGETSDRANKEKIKKYQQTLEEMQELLESHKYEFDRKQGTLVTAKTNLDQLVEKKQALEKPHKLVEEWRRIIEVNTPWLSSAPILKGAQQFIDTMQGRMIINTSEYLKREMAELADKLKNLEILGKTNDNQDINNIEGNMKEAERAVREAERAVEEAEKRRNKSERDLGEFRDIVGEARRLVSYMEESKVNDSTILIQEEDVKQAGNERKLASSIDVWLAKELAKQEKRLLELSNSQEKQKGVLPVIDKNLQNLREELRTLTETLDGTQSQLGLQDDSTKTSQSDLAIAKQNEENLKMQQKNLEDSIEGKQNQVKQLEGEVKVLLNTIGGIVSEIEGIKNRNKQLRAEIEPLQAKVLSLKKEIEEKKTLLKEIEKLLEINSGIQRKIKILEENGNKDYTDKLREEISFFENERKKIRFEVNRKDYYEEVKLQIDALIKQFGEVSTLLMNGRKNLGLNIPENVTKVESKSVTIDITDDQSYLSLRKDLVSDNGRVLISGKLVRARSDYLHCRDAEKPRIESYLEKVALMNAIDIIKPILDGKQAIDEEFKQNLMKNWNKFREIYGEKKSRLSEMTSDLYRAIIGYTLAKNKFDRESNEDNSNAMNSRRQELQEKYDKCREECYNNDDESKSSIEIEVIASFEKLKSAYVKFYEQGFREYSAKIEAMFKYYSDRRQEIGESIKTKLQTLQERIGGEIDKLQEEEKSFQEKITPLEGTITSNNETKKSLIEQKRDIDGEVRKKNTQIRDLLINIDRDTKAKEEIQEKIAESKKEVDKIAKQLEQRKLEIQREIQELQEKRRVAQEELAAIEEKATQVRQSKETLASPHARRALMILMGQSR